MKKRIILLLLTILLVASVQGISNTITYMVEDADYGGSARNGLYNTTISYCNAQSGGNKIYNFTIPFVNYTSSKAFIDVNITSDLNFNQDLWIETVVNGTTYARKKISSNLNTYEANNTQKLGGYDSSLFARNNTGTWNLDINSTTMCIDGLCISTWDAVNGSAVDTNLNETEVEGYIFDNDNTGSMITSGDITANAINISYIYSKFSATGMDIRADSWYLSNAGFEVSAGKDFCINGGVCLSSVDTNTDTNTLYTADNIYIYNSTNTMTFNETKLNATIDARDTDTTYSDLSEFDNDEGFYNTEANLTTLLDGNYADISVTDTTYTAGDGITLTGTEFNTTYQTNQDTGTGDGVTFSSAQLTSALTVSNGGTGTQTFTDGGVLFGDGTGDIDVSAQLPAGTQLIGVAEGTNPALVVTFTAHDGFLKHEFGGLEADVSSYTDGLYGMISGATADIDTIAELNTAIGVKLAVTDSAETFDENVAFAKNITQGDNDYHCYGDSNDACIYWNGTALRIG